MSASLQDAAARRVGRSEFGHAVVLEAGAGSGKTAVLVARVVHWVLGPGWQKYQGLATSEATAEAVAQGVVAITFTDAAAVEMQSRVASALRGICLGDAPNWLEQAEIDCPADIVVERAAAMLTASDRLRIQTIHSFCSAILRDYALRIGVHPNFRIDADGSLLEERALETVQLHLDELYGEDADEDALLLAVEGFGPAALANHLRVLAARALSPDDLPLEPISDAAFAAWKTRVLTPLRDATEVLQESIAIALGGKSEVPGRLNKIHAVWRSLAALTEALESSQNASDLPAVFGPDGPAGSLDLARLQKWAKGEWTQSEQKVVGLSQRSVVEDFCVEFPARARMMRRFKPEVLEAGCRLMRKLLADLQERMQQDGVQVFDGLLRNVRQLLRDDAQVASWIRASIDQLLVDEFQDTDAGQCELISRLALDVDLEAPCPGLFLVGDPKQSIYGWRSADLRAYSAFVARVLAQGGEQQSLQVNFRSVQPILDEVEELIHAKMVKDEGRQPDFTPLLVRPDAVGDEGFQALSRRAVEHWVSWSHDDTDWKAHGSTGADTNSDAARQLEARSIASELVELHQAGELAWGDVALLMRATSHLDVYLAAFREAGIPFQVERDRSYYRRREILDAACLVRCVLDPHDQLALIAFLRSPMVGVPDAAWLPLWSAEAPAREDQSYRPRFPELVAKLHATIAGEVQGDLEAIVSEASQLVADLHAPGVDQVENWPASLRYALQQLGALRQSFAVDPADRFVDKLRAAFAQEGTESARFLGAHRLANLERFYLNLSEAMQQADVGPQAILRQLRVATMESRDESEAAPGDESVDAVRVMTVHKSKGLTFSQVYLVDTHGGSRTSQPLPTVDWANLDGSLELCLFGVPTLGWEHVEREREAVRAAETVRLLYVALTRPEHRLVICGRRNPDVDAASGADTLEGLIRHRQPPRDLVEWFQECRGSDASVLDARDVRWRMPWQDAQQGSAPAVAAGQVGFTARQAIEEVSRLQLLATEAKRRSSMDRMATASGQVSHEQHRMEFLAYGEELEFNPALRIRGERALAQAVGTAVHRVFESINLNLDPQLALENQQERLSELLHGLFEVDKLPDILRETQRILDQANRNGIIHELFERRDHILGREVPVLLRDEARAEAAVSGTLDLLYRDPGTGRLIVADFKTDAVHDEAHLQQLCEHYRAQGQVYCRAVESIFDAEEPPSFELWFLLYGEIRSVTL